MINVHTNKPPLNRVTAIFADSSQSFLLPQGATLEQIADRIDRLGARHEQRDCRCCGQIRGHRSARFCAEIAHRVSRRIASRTAPASSVCQIHGS